MARGTYERTPEIRARNRANAVPAEPCPEDCTCGRHGSYGGGRACQPGCTCGRHRRSKEHNEKIGVGVSMRKPNRKKQ